MKTQVVRESSTAVLDIDVEQAKALNSLGQQLVSDKKWWGTPEEDEEDEGSRTVVRCQSSATGQWTISVGDVIGTIAVPELQLIVVPKIPLVHFFFLLELTDQWPRLDTTRVQLDKDVNLLELLAHWFLNSVEDVLRKDLIRDYRSIIDELTAVRGRLEPVPSAEMYYSGRLSTLCEFEEFDTDTPLNRLLKAAAEAIVANPLIGIERRRRAKRAVLRMGDVGDLKPADLLASIDNRTAHYRDAILLARNVLRGLGRDLSAGSETSFAFLLRTPGMVETAVRSLLARGLRGMCQMGKKPQPIHGAGMTLNPDLTFGNIPAIADVKYRLAKSAWSRSELYQAVAFAAGSYVSEAAIVTFRDSDTPALPILRVGDVWARQFSWLLDPLVSPQQAAQSLVAHVKAWLGGIAASATAA